MKRTGLPARLPRPWSMPDIDLAVELIQLIAQIPPTRKAVGGLHISQDQHDRKDTYGSREIEY
jgi:hypothetical protein